MRTNIDIDDELLARALKITGEKTKRGVVEKALRLLVERTDKRRALDELRGIGWDGNLDEIRGAS